MAGETTTEQYALRSLSLETTRHVFSFLPQATLRKCRFLSRDFEALANVFAFRHIRLTAVGNDAKRFVEVAKSPKLRQFVREVTCDTWIGPEFEYGRNEEYDVPELFMKSLPYLRCFSLMTILNLRFNELTGNNDRDYLYVDIEESYDFRFRVMDTVFRCLAGQWSADKQEKIDEHLSLDMNLDSDSEEGSTSENGSENGRAPALPEDETWGPIPVQTITVSNLGDYDDVRLTAGKAFRKVIDSGSVKDLKLSIVLEGNEAAPEHAIEYPEKYELFRSLPRTWLSPKLAENLRVLSLYCEDYWGWNPPMHFRDVNPASGGFPNLRVLALGNFVFSHEWQIAWIASLGSKNGRGGLEELYLDGCPVMYHARLNPPHFQSMTAVGKSFENKFLIDGYPLEELVTNKLTAGTPRGSRTTQVPYPLRWHSILRQWQEKMKPLKVFKMGKAIDSWEVGNIILAATKETTPEEGQLQYGRHDREAAAHPYEQNEFRYFDCPTPPEDTEDLHHGDKYSLGVGLSQSREYQLPYVYFDMGLGPSQWIETTYADQTNTRAPPLEEEAKELDEDALQSLLETVKQRKMGKSCCLDDA